MTLEIFRLPSQPFNDTAPAYWAKGLSAIPLMGGQKRPAITRWQEFSHRMPTGDEQAEWLAAYPDNNIGLVLGPSSGIVIIDLDSEDPQVRAVLDQVLPKSPWERRGKKGAAFAYRYKEQRTFQILGPDRKPLVECLSRGRQVALPPSIHPDTQRPYLSNVPLLDVISVLPELPKDVEIVLREAFRDAGIDVQSSGNIQVSSFIPAGARDNAMVSHAGILARAVTRGERGLLEALGEMGHWVENYTEQVAGDALDPDKARLKVVEFLKRDVFGDRRLTLPDGWDAGLTDEDKEKMGLAVEDVNERWGVERVCNHLAAEFTRWLEPQTEGWTNAIDVALDRIARNPDLSELGQERILKFIVNQSKGLYTLATLRKRLRELRRGELVGENHNEIARAVIKDIERFGELRFSLGRFWQWKGAAWEPVGTNVFHKTISDDYGHLPAARKFSDVRGIVNTMKELCTGDLISAAVTGINFANGFLSESLELKPHDRQYGATYVLPYRYLPGETHCPLFMQLLNDCWGGDADFAEKMEALQEFMAATLMGLAPRYQRAICLIGVAQSGKSRIMEIMKGLMPRDVFSAVPPTDWGDKFMPAQMAGKLMNVAGEISETKAIQGDIFKQVVEGSEISGQFKNQPIFTFHPTAAQWFLSNHIPKTKDTSAGFNRRWLFLEFPRTIPNDQIIRDIDQIILSQEREPIAAWVMEGMPRLLKNRGYTLPYSHTLMAEKLASLNNPVDYFLRNSLRLAMSDDADRNEPAAEIDGFTLFTEFCEFSRSWGQHRLGQVRFHEAMKALELEFGFRQIPRAGAAGGCAYQGISLVQAPRASELAVFA